MLSLTQVPTDYMLIVIYIYINKLYHLFFISQVYLPQNQWRYQLMSINVKTLITLNAINKIPKKNYLKTKLNILLQKHKKQGIDFFSKQGIDYILNIKYLI